MLTRQIAGRDIIEQLRGKLETSLLLIPGVALRDGAFVDDEFVGSIGEALGASAKSGGASPASLIEALA